MSNRPFARRDLFGAAIALAATGGLAACAKQNPAASASGGTTITLGFAQVGSESGWRTANTTSIKDAATAAGITLKFSDAQQKQENQISAIRTFIQQKVDVIAFSPVVVSGWDTVLEEARTAGIPVVLTDRAIDTEDETLYVTFIGSDFTAEGERAGRLLEEILDGQTGPFNIAQLEGTTGSAPALERTEGFATVLAEHDDWKIVATQSGDFTRAGGKQVMEAFLQSHPEINVLYAQNDDMGLGAIQAIEAAGKVPGEDIKIVTVDAVKDGFVALSEGKINGLVECNPLLGPVLMENVKTIAAGGTVERRIVTEEKDFLEADAAAELPNRKY